MAAQTLIAWTNHTFNPWMGCTKVSVGCRNCYAEKLTKNRMGIEAWGPRTLRPRTNTPWANVDKWERDTALANRIDLVFTGSLCNIFENHPDATRLHPSALPAAKHTTRRERSE